MLEAILETAKSIGRVLFKVKYAFSDGILETVIDFEDRGQDIYYCWTLCDKNVGNIAAKCLPISKRIIQGNEIEYCIAHAKTGIDMYRIDRQKVFQVLEVKKL
jgi:hypothetical protein